MHVKISEGISDLDLYLDLDLDGSMLAEGGFREPHVLVVGRQGETARRTPAESRSCLDGRGRYQRTPLTPPLPLPPAAVTHLFVVGRQGEEVSSAPAATAAAATASASLGAATSAPAHGGPARGVGVRGAACKCGTISVGIYFRRRCRT